MVNKLPPELDNPLETLINAGVDTQLPLYHWLGLSPNGLTTISLAAGLLACVGVYYDYIWPAAVLWLIAYYFDCADGKMARKYGLTSAFGDLYDHASDVLKHCILLLLLLYKLPSGQIPFLLGLFVLLLLVGSQMGCQERYLHENDQGGHASLTLKVLEQLIVLPNDCLTQMRYTRYFSPATLTVYFTAAILALRV